MTELVPRSAALRVVLAVVATIAALAIAFVSSSFAAVFAVVVVSAGVAGGLVVLGALLHRHRDHSWVWVVAVLVVAAVVLDATGAELAAAGAGGLAVVVMGVGIALAGHLSRTLALLFALSQPLALVDPELAKVCIAIGFYGLGFSLAREARSTRAQAARTEEPSRSTTAPRNA